MKPAPIVRYEIELEHGRVKQMLVAAVISTAMILVLAAMFLSAL
jgi:hypothetical protein